MNMRRKPTFLIFLSSRDGSKDSKESSEDGHTVVATARGVFDDNGGVLESKETGVSIIIPKGAIPGGKKQEIYFKVCQDNSILPPLDKEKGRSEVRVQIYFKVKC